MGLTGRDPRSHDESGKQLTLGKVGTKTSKGVRRNPEIGKLLWYQRSREEWIESGDRNTIFPCGYTIKKNRNTIRVLLNDQGIWVTDQTLLKEMIQGYF